MQNRDLEGKVTNIDLIQISYKEMMAALDIQEMFENIIDRMKPYLDQKPVAAGEYLYKQSELCSDVFFIQRGQVTLSKKNRQNQTTRLRTLGPWTITGEIGAYLDHITPYDAIVAKDEDLSMLKWHSILFLILHRIRRYW